MKKFFKIVLPRITEIATIIYALFFAILGLINTIEEKKLLGIILIAFSTTSLGLLFNNVKLSKLLSIVGIIKDNFRYSSDKFFRFKSEYEETQLFENVEHELYLIQETGSLIIEQNKKQIITFLNKNGILKCVLVSPDLDSMYNLAIRNNDLNIQSLINRTNSFNEQINTICNRIHNNCINISVRYLPYPIPFSSVFSDCTSHILKKQKALIRYADFKVAYDDKLDFLISADNEPQIYQHFYSQFINQYLFSYKFILLSGESKSGKTTLFNRLIQNNDSRCIAYFITNEMLKNEKRVGFNLVTSIDNKRIEQVLATKKSNGEYDINIDVLDNLANNLLIAENAGKIIIFDEIGILQLKSAKLVCALNKLLLNPIVTVFATISLNDDDNNIVSDIKNNVRTDYYQLVRTKKENNEHKLYELLDRELKASISLYSLKSEKTRLEEARAKNG